LFSVLGTLVPSQELAISVVFSLTDILSARFLTMISSDENEKWRIAAKYFPTPTSEKD
jgi:hypothetical protein